MATRIIVAQLIVFQQAAPGNVFTRNYRTVFDRLEQTNTRCAFATSHLARGSRLPTDVQSGKRNLPRRSVQLRSGSPPGASRQQAPPPAKSVQVAHQFWARGQATELTGAIRWIIQEQQSYFVCDRSAVHAIAADHDPRQVDTNRRTVR